MRLSKLFTRTTKESSADSSSKNADLLERAGFIHKTLAGAYTYLPLGYRVLRKIEQIVREEMDTIATETLMTALSPQESWAKTGRLESIDVLFEARGGNDSSRKVNPTEYVLCGTNEEVVTPLVQHYTTSYQDLPCATYQLQTKFRNEARPKSGILRGREFRMKDLYSFHADEDDMTRYFNEEALPAYERVFERLGIGDLTVRAWASGGDFSKQNSLEFQTRCEVGEDLIFNAPGSDTFYNREICPVIPSVWDNSSEEEKEREDVVGEGIIGVEELAKFLNIEVLRTTKTILFETDEGKVVAAAVRGDRDVDEHKLKAVIGCSTLELASADTVKNVTGAEVGYAGPINLPDDVQVVWDHSCAGRKNFECGANKTNEHSVNCNFGRDVDAPAEFYDISIAQAGDSDPESGKEYETFSASEVGNLFTLYTKYTDAFGFTYTAQDGSLQPVYMGCYGLGTTRVLGVMVEVLSDDDGLVWPEAVAPAKVHIVPIAKTADEDAFVQAEGLYEELTSKGVECLFDDRLKQSVGSRLADADLIGVPTRVVVSAKTLAAEGCEVKDRQSGDITMMSIADLQNRYS